MKAFLARLKERKVIRATGVYAVAGYGVFQIANNMLPALNLPAWTVTLTAVVFLLGFPVVALLSYVFEWTDQGLQRTPEHATAPESTRLGWLNWALLAATAAVLVVVAAYYVALPAIRLDPAASAVADKSIAVLPFVNFSASTETEYFADGLTEELINGLAQLPELKVAGRTSSFYFKGRNEDIREIGRRLGVAHVLEGSVRRSGESLRITAQLIQVADGFHLWSETFDRRMDDAFVIQTQIARAVADRLEARLLRTDAAGQTRDPRAYQLELVARSRLRKQELEELQAARVLYSELIDVEPRNANAYTGYAEATITLAQSFLALDFEEARGATARALETALGLDPMSSEAWRVRGFFNRVLSIRTGEQRYFDEALADLQRAAEIDPRNADAIALLASQLLTGGQVEQAAAMLRRSLEIDPLARVSQQLLGTALERQGRFGEARRQYETLIELYPDYTNAKVALGTSLIAQGRLDDAVGVLENATLLESDPIAGLLLANCYANLAMPQQMHATLARAVEPRIVATIAKFVALQRDGDSAALRALVTTELEATNDPVWRSARLMIAVRDRDAAAAKAALESMSLAPVSTGDPLDRSSAMDALLIADALRLTGEPGRAERIAEALLQRLEAAPGEFVPNDTLVMQALTFAFLDRADEALDLLERARAQGFRTPIDFEYFLRLDEYPFMERVGSDARYLALMSAIAADNERMRERLLASAR